MGKIVSTNITVSVPAELRQAMEQFEKRFPETNWSSICRQAIQEHMFVHGLDAPQVGVFLESIVQEIATGIGPGIRTTLRVENRMPIPILVDRIKITTSLFSGANLIVGRERWHLTPLHIRQNSSATTSDFFYTGYNDLMATEELVTRSIVVNQYVNAWITGFNAPVGSQFQGKIPLDEWQTHLANVKQWYGKRAPGKS